MGKNLLAVAVSKTAMIAANLNRLIFRRDLYLSRTSLRALRNRSFPEMNGFPVTSPHSLFRRLLLLLALSLGAMTNATAQTRDVAGARDHPCRECGEDVPGRHRLGGGDFHKRSLSQRGTPSARERVPSEAKAGEG